MLVKLPLRAMFLTGSLMPLLKVSLMYLELPRGAHRGRGMLLSNRELPPVVFHRVHLLSDRRM